MLSPQQVARFKRDGFLLLKDALSAAQLRPLQRQFAQWVEESRARDAPYGETLDRRARFDLERGHSAERPALRRVASPIEISNDYLRAMRESKAVDAIADLLGPNIKFHHCKINSKLPRAATEVKFHQDFLYEPHSNDDLITALLFLDDVTTRNGPLEVVPGSHRGPLHGLWHDGVFTGAVAPRVAAELTGRTVQCTGAAGAACLMHTRLLHGSAANRSTRPRTLFIAIYSAEDALPLSPNPLPSRYAGEIVRGRATNRVRCSDYAMEFPEVPKSASFFDQQANTLARG
ncbi:MAG: phytanoyl-CoA dioxygenase family protein [bacterium]